MKKPKSISRSTSSTDLEGLSTLYAAPLRRYFVRRGCKAQDVDDLVQEVFFRIIRLDKLNTIENPGGYVFQIAANLLKDTVRKQHTRHENMHKPFDDLLHGSQDITPERQLAGKQALGELKTVLMSMPDKTRVVFLLHRFEGLKYREIAQVLNITVSAVEKHMMKSLVKLAKLKRQL